MYPLLLRVLDVNSIFKIKNPKVKTSFKNMLKLVCIWIGAMTVVVNDEFYQIQSPNQRSSFTTTAIEPYNNKGTTGYAGC